MRLFNAIVSHLQSHLLAVQGVLHEIVTIKRARVLASAARSLKTPTQAAIGGAVVAKRLVCLRFYM